MHVAVVKTFQQPYASVLHEMNLDSAVTEAILRQKCRERALDSHRRRSDSQYPGVPTLERPRPRAERVGVHEQTATLPKKILALRRQSEAPTDSIEQSHAEIGLERENLARCRRLAEVQTTARPSDATGVSNADERVQMAEVHVFSCRIHASRMTTINALDTSRRDPYSFMLHPSRQQAEQAGSQPERLESVWSSFVVACCGGCRAHGAWAAQHYPARPVRVIVPFAPGGATDVIARLMTHRLSEDLGQPFYIENIPGASGDIGTLRAARAVADGYTLLFAFSSYVTSPSLSDELPDDPYKDFDPITLAVVSPAVFLANPSVAAKNIEVS